MPTPEQKSYTIKDLESLPEGRRAELIDGVLYDLAAPSVRHQRTLMALYRHIADQIDRADRTCEAFIAPFAVFPENSNSTYLEPDLSVVCDPSKIDDRGCHGAPDWIIEIVSPASRRMDYIIKLFKYRTVGVRLYWIVDPSRRVVRTYNFETDDTADYSFDEKIPVPISDDFSIRLSDFI